MFANGSCLPLKSTRRSATVTRAVPLAARASRIASGAIANHISMFIGLPLTKGFVHNDFVGRMLVSVFAVQYVDFPFTATFAGLGATTEWSVFIDDKHITQKSFFIGAGVADYYLMGLYANWVGYKIGFVANDEPEAPSAPPEPRYAWTPQLYDLGHGVTGYGASARIAF